MRTASPEKRWLLFAAATAGNALGGMTSWCIGRFIPERRKEDCGGRAVAWLRRYGCWALLLTWLPVVGDALPVAAGWLRLGAAKSFLFIAIGKALRYAVVLGAVAELAS